MQVGDSALGFTLAAVADVPAAGHWLVAAERHEEAEVWVRAPRTEESRLVAKLAWERLRNLDHPSIPEVVGWEEETGALAVAAPYGVSISHLVELRRCDPEVTMNPGTVLDMAYQLADLLVHAHERGRPHGHLSPSQIWLTPEGELVVWGFGDGPSHEPEPAWTPPERARGQRASGDADQWALAGLIAALVIGREPWMGDDPAAEARVGDTTHLSGPVVDQWKALGRIVERALHDEPQERFPSIHPMRQAIRALAERVRQPSALPELGGKLVARFGVALPVEPVAAKMPSPPSDVEAEVPTVVDEGPPDFDPPTPVPPESPPADFEEMETVAGEDSLSDVPTVGEQPGLAAELKDRVPLPVADPDAVETHRPTTPTSVPSEDAPPAVVSEDDEGPTTLGNVSVADRIPVAPHPPSPTRAGADITLIAPWVVGGMVVLLAVYLVWVP